MKAPYAGAEEMLPQMNRKLIIRNEKSSRFSNNVINSFPLPPISKCRSRYEADFTVSVSVISFILISLEVDAMY